MRWGAGNERTGYRQSPLAMAGDSGRLRGVAVVAGTDAHAVRDLGLAGLARRSDGRAAGALGAFARRRGAPGVHADGADRGAGGAGVAAAAGRTAVATDGLAAAAGELDHRDGGAVDRAA